MKIKLNPDQEIVNTIREGLKRTGGYCHCRRERTEATKCMCQEFKDQIADSGFEGFCHCSASWGQTLNAPAASPRPAGCPLSGSVMAFCSFS